MQTLTALEVLSARNNGIQGEMRVQGVLRGGTFLNGFFYTMMGMDAVRIKL